jgi:phosphoserine phosphatase RsbU/P
MLAVVWAGWCLLGVVLLGAVCVARAQGAVVQPVDATEWHSGTVTLNDGWRERDGDDAAWAQPEFNDSDSAWTPVALNDQGPARPGWRWYRLHLKLASDRPHEHLLLVGGEGVYELYVNGQREPDTHLLSMFGVKRPVEQVVVLSDDVDDFTLALRTRAAQSYMIWKLPLFLTAAVGSADAIDNERVSFESQRVYAAIPSLAINGLLLLAGLGAFALYLSQSKRAEYLWLGLYLFLLGLSNGLLYGSVSGLVALAWNNQLGDPLIYVYTIMQIEFTFSFAGRRVNRAWRVYETLLALSIGMNWVDTFGLLRTDVYVAIQALILLPAALLLPVLLLVWYRKGNREAGWLIAPSLLPAAAAALYDLGNGSIFSGWGKLDFLADPIPFGLVSLQLSDIGDFLFVLAIGIVMFFRFTKVSREQARGAAELEAAREIQQRLVPTQVPQIKGYRIEAAYLPAQEVGGDFYQVFEQDDGMQLVAVGDVSGKGLKAAMTGTLALGALRALAAEGLGPAATLTKLNRQIAETAEGGFITCICVQLGSDGEVIIANAGHLSPYRNGEELVVSSDLPLGISASEVYEERAFRLEPEDRLTLLSDGVLEARDARGELFGFERTRAISGQSAANIAETAQSFGQEDDITVLTLARERKVVGDEILVAAASA